MELPNFLGNVFKKKKEKVPEETESEENYDKEDRILKILDDLMQMEDVLACMVAKKGLESGLSPPKLKIDNLALWRLVDKTTDELFDISKHFYDYGLDRIYLEIGDYTIIMATLNPVFALIVVIPSLANRGLIDVEVENTKRKIQEVIEAKGP